ncbi:hypothetical protein ACFWY5_52220 [Nonomuraea sp. NPDC059007]
MTRVQARAHAADARGDDTLERGAEAFNFAALILSDGGHPALARDLC